MMNLPARAGNKPSAKPTRLRLDGSYWLTDNRWGPNITPDSRLCLVLVGLQVADGVLTAVGVSHLGLHAEGNTMLRALMATIGTIPALILIKSLAILALVPLVAYVTQVKWLPAAMMSVIALYVIFAIIPWGVVLCTRVFNI